MVICVALAGPTLPPICEGFYMKTLYSKKIESPVGELTLIANDDALVAVLWEKEKRGRVKTGAHLSVKKHAIR
jgi:Holliday junction resolvase-like predicted endonuclease